MFSYLHKENKDVNIRRNATRIMGKYFVIDHDSNEIEIITVYWETPFIIWDIFLTRSTLLFSSLTKMPLILF